MSNKDLVLFEQGRGNVVLNDASGLYITPLEELIDQPVLGLLYDLNRNEATILNLVEDPKWVNDYACAQVIRALYKKIEALEKASQWISVEDKPLVTVDADGNWECTEAGEGMFMASVPYLRLGEAKVWTGLCIIEDEVGLCEVVDGNPEHCGWDITDVTHYIKVNPLPPRPEASIIKTK